MSTISEINPVFCTPYTELANTDALTTLTKSCPEKIEFLLKIVVNASRTRSSGADRFYPDPFVYMQHIYSETLNETDFDEFIRVISSTRPFHEKLIERLYFGQVASSFFLNNSRAKRALGIKIAPSPHRRQRVGKVFRGTFISNAPLSCSC